MRLLLILLQMTVATAMMAATGTWHSTATDSNLTYTTLSPTGMAAKDVDGKAMTIVYLENLGFQKIGQNSNADDVAWLRNEGYQVIELDYGHHEKAVSPMLNADIIAINSSLQNGKFCGSNCSPSRSYILMEGYRIQRDIPYYHDDPTVYNYPDVYKDSEGDWLYLDLVYPANPSVEVPVVVTFSYSSSFATNSNGKLTDANKQKRMYLPYFWGAFKDSFVEGASAVGFAWAVCDHPKYCDWGQGRYTGGANKSLGAIEVNPDAARKVKSAIRTVRGIGKSLGLNGQVAVTGFSRGSTAAAVAVGNGQVDAYEDATRGRYPEESSLVQCALLGSGMFDYEHALSSSNEYIHMNSFVTVRPDCPWTMQGALATIETNASAPTLFFYNTDDYYKDSNKNPQGLYATQTALMKAKLDAVGTPTATLVDYSSGHAVPQTTATLQTMYDFLTKHIPSPINGIKSQYGPLGFVNYNDGINGITGGMAGEVVRVTNRTDLAKYANDPKPYTIIVEGKYEGSGLNRTKDIIEVNSNKTIVGVKGAELAGIGLNINGKENIIIRNLIIHHADPDGIAARNSHHIWVDHCDVYSQDEADKEDWDGLIDLTVGSSYLTVSYCYIHDHHKACLLNSGTMHFEDNGKNRATYHHNSFMRTDQRNPRIGYGLGHVFCNYYQDIGSYAIGIHTQAKVLSESNYYDASVKNAFEQMYASSLDDASCGFVDDNNSYFGKAQATDFKHKLTGTDFQPAWWYDYAFALEPAANLPSLTEKTGPVEGLEYEPILWPGNGATDITLDTKPAYSKIEGMTSAEVLFGTSKENMQAIDLDNLILQPSTTYYWQVRERNAKGSYTSPVYQFTTAGEKAAKPYPADGEKNTPLRAASNAEAKTEPMALCWRPAADAKNYRVTLWTEDGNPQQTTTTSALTWNPGTLLYGKNYSWRVDVEKNDDSIVEGDTWTFSAPARPITVGRTEMEHLARSAYAYLEREDGSWFKASNDSVTVGEAGPGAMTGVWMGDDGSYELSVDFYDEKAGQAWMGLSVNDVLIDSWKGVKQYAMTTHKVTNEIALHHGDQIRVDFYTQSKMRCRIDCIDVKAGTSGIGNLPVADAQQPTAIYDLNGRRVTSGNLKPGIYIINKKKIIIR